MIPNFDLRAFVDILSQDEVNKIDGIRNQPTAKFAELVGIALSDEEYGWRHLVIAFYYEMPFDTAFELKAWQYANQFRITEQTTGLMTRGIISGAFDIWYEFLKWASDRDSTRYLRAYANLMHNYLKQYSYFSKLKISNLSDSTYVLE